jgi:ribosomal protein S18 acetylase RimI-like enzyme
VRIHTVQLRDWPDYRDIRLAALKDAPSAFASTWRQEAALTESQWMERAQRSEEGDTATIVIAVDDAGRRVGLAGGYRPGDRGADAELISMWVAPDCRGRTIGSGLVRAVLAWADSHQAVSVGLWVNETNQPAISLYEKEGFRRTGEVDKLPSDPTQQEIHMLRRANGRLLPVGGMDAERLIGEPPCGRGGLGDRWQDQVEVPFQARALDRDEPQGAIGRGREPK